jgi:predicted Zn-dependent peptidase
MTRPQIVSFQHAHYVTGSTVVTAAGRLHHEKVLKAVTRVARQFTHGRRPPYIPAVVQQSSPQVRLFTKATEQTQVALGIRACSRHDERRFALRLLNTILGENMSSRLFQIIREDRGLAYSIHSSLSHFDDVGTLTICAGLETEQLPRVLKLVLVELKRLADHPPTLAELRRARDYLLGQIDLSLESTENQMMWLGEQILGYGKIISPSEIKQSLLEVKAGQIRSLAREFFRPERFSLALVSPLKSEAGLLKLLKF